jgi:hypothetical protein
MSVTDLLFIPLLCIAAAIGFATAIIRFAADKALKIGR